MKQIISLSFLIVLVGCEDAKRLYTDKVDNKKYFICEEENRQFESSIKEPLIIDLDKKTIYWYDSTYIDLENKNDSVIRAYVENDQLQYVTFDRLTGELFWAATTHNFFYKCRKTEPLI